MDMATAKRIGEVMVSISEQVVWPHVVDIALANGYHASHPFSARVGTGKKTYHQLVERTDKGGNTGPGHKVIYGVKMIMAKVDPERRAKWLSCKELVKYGYFGGDTSYASTLAHTVIHEMAHALQVICGKRLRRSVHNDAFYKFLTDLHWACGQKVKELLERALVNDGIEGIHSQAEFRSKTSSHVVKPEKGTLISYTGKGGRNLAVVTRRGPTRARVYIYAGANAGRLMLVPYSMIKPLDPADRRPPQALLDDLITQRKTGELVSLHYNGKQYLGRVSGVKGSMVDVDILNGALKSSYIHIAYEEVRRVPEVAQAS